MPNPFAVGSTNGASPTLSPEDAAKIHEYNMNTSLFDGMFVNYTQAASDYMALKGIDDEATQAGEAYFASQNPGFIGGIKNFFGFGNG